MDEQIEVWAATFVEAAEVVAGVVNAELMHPDCSLNN
jgi:hypothetical protein